MWIIFAHFPLIFAKLVIKTTIAIATREAQATALKGAQKSKLGLAN
jgi:hypothetical protein